MKKLYVLIGLSAFSLLLHVATSHPMQRQRQDDQEDTAMGLHNAFMRVSTYDSPKIFQEVGLHECRKNLLDGLLRIIVFYQKSFDNAYLLSSMPTVLGYLNQKELIYFIKILKNCLKNNEGQLPHRQVIERLILVGDTLIKINTHFSNKAALAHIVNFAQVADDFDPVDLLKEKFFLNKPNIQELIDMLAPFFNTLPLPEAQLATPVMTPATIIVPARPITISLSPWSSFKLIQSEPDQSLLSDKPRKLVLEIVGGTVMVNELSKFSQSN